MRHTADRLSCMNRRFAWAIGAVCVIWAYGLFVHHHVEVRTPGHRAFMLAEGSGTLYVRTQHIVGPADSVPPPRITIRHLHRITGVSDPLRSPVFRYVRDAPLQRGGTISEVEIGLPLWLVVAVLLAPPLQRLVRQRLSARTSVRRRAAGLCVICSYDLSGTPDRCPECGQPAGVTGAA